MFSTLFKYNIILIVLCIGMELIHNSLQTITEGESSNSIVNITTSPLHINLHCSIVTPPCRSVSMTAEALKLQFDLLYVDLLHSGKHDPEFLEINFEYNLSTTRKHNFILSESHAIICYLVKKYGGKDNSLYPDDEKKQARIEQFLGFNKRQLYPSFENQYNTWIFEGVPKTDEREKQIHEQLGYLEKYLESSSFAAGESLTVADIALVATISTFEVAGVDLKNYHKINAWFENCKTILVGYEKYNQIGIDEIKKMIALRMTIDSSNIKLYYSNVSPPCRSVLLTAKALHLEFNLRHIDLLHGGEKDTELETINFQCSVPTIQEDDIALWGSHAIILYLVKKYGGENNPLYPNDLEKQSRIKEILHLTTFFENQYNPWIFDEVKITDEKKKKIHKQLGYLEKYLDSSTFIAGESVTVADIALVVSISTLKVVGVDFMIYQKINDWLEKCESELVGYKEVNQRGIDEINKIATSRKKISEASKVSPECRSIFLTAKALEINLDDIPISFDVQYEFLEISFDYLSISVKNKEGGVISKISEILYYLATHYGKGKNLLYPDDQKIQEQINKLLTKNEKLFIPNIKNIYNSWIFFGGKPNYHLFTRNVRDALNELESNFFKSNTWVAGSDSATVADMILVASISTFEVAGVNFTNYPNIKAWLQMCKNKLVGYKEANQEGIDIIKKYIDDQNKN